MLGERAGAINWPRLLTPRELLEEITRPLKEEVLSQLMARRHDYLHTTGRDRSQLYKGLLGTFDSRWAYLNTRIPLVPGKEVLRRFRQRVQDLHNVTLTDARIIESLHREDIPSDMRRLLNSLDSFRIAQP